MRLIEFLFLVLFSCFLCTALAKKNPNDDDFAEFEEFDGDEFVLGILATLSL